MLRRIRGRIVPPTLLLFFVFVRQLVVSANLWQRPRGGVRMRTALSLPVRSHVRILGSELGSDNSANSWHSPYAWRCAHAYSLLPLRGQSLDAPLRAPVAALTIPQA